MEMTLPDAERADVGRETDGLQADASSCIGRQHANEVSSTSHILRLGELLATDPAYTRVLKKVNVVLCPVMNPDGAQMAYELQKLTPTYMLHAGRYSALGMDVTSRAGGLLPEAEVEGTAVAAVAAGHLPQSARLPVARVGAAVLRLRRAGFPRLLELARVVHDAERPARPARTRTMRRPPRRCARRSCARSTATRTSAR